MTTIRAVFGVLLSVSLMWAQSSPTKQSSSTNAPNDLASEVESLRNALAETQKQVAAQQREIEALKNGSKSTGTPLQNEQRSGPVLQPKTQSSSASSNAAGETGFRIGSLVFTPGGFVDLENIYRTTNTQSNIATNFAAIPFNNTEQGNISEFRTTAQFSRLSLLISSKFGIHDITSYIETDFSGNNAPNVYQSVNGHTNRLRLFFADGRLGKWEILGGQTWSWITPNRNGLGPMPVDLALTYNEDQNLTVGIPYTRAAELRVAYHFNDRWAFGVGIENPNQFIGNFVALPAAFITVGSQFDNGNQIGAPNAFPDILSKLAYDKKFSRGRHFHAEAVGLITGVHMTAKPLRGISFNLHRTVGGGGSVASNYEFSPNFRILANAFWSDGGAHYLVGTGPQVVIRPNPAGTDVTPSFVHAGAGSAGFEWHVTPKAALAAYYGVNYFRRNFFPDTTNTADPRRIIGYGGPGSPDTNNRTIQQATFDWIQTFWKDPTFGAVQFYAQYSYLTRAPWFVAPGQPKNAHLSMVFAGLRYILPSTSATLERVARPQ
jgi:hypothetical protein